MIIDSAVYGGKCACGREHPMDTKLSVVEEGCLGRGRRLIAGTHLHIFKRMNR